MHLSLTANPSHLEAVNPVVLGKVRAKQTQKRDTERARVMGLLLHGDAAFAGQGVVHEGLEMSELRGFRTGGTIHLIVNNQIGFTTSPAYARSSPYPSDGARSVQAPIFHVNGDDPEAVVHVARLAAEFRQKFKKDVVIDLWCYRRHGHNEGDEPSFTQPLMYRKIAQHPTTRQIYTKRLVEEGVISEEDAQALYDAFQERMSAAHESAAGYKMNKADWLEGAWSGLTRAPEQYERGSTAVPLELIRDVGLATTVPESVHLHRKLERIIGERRKSIESGTDIDWATAEHLAFGTLLREGFPVRLSGQDSGRGTFSQRHAILYDQTTEERYIPLAHLHPEQAPFEVVDSPLSEAGVLGFEYGYSSPTPTRWFSGRRSLAISRTAPRSTSTSSSRPARPSGCACRGWSASCPTATKARARSTARRAWNASCSCTPKTTSRSCTRRLQPATSTRCAARCTVVSASR